MAKKELPPIELLRKLLRYDPDSGLMFWRERSSEMFSSERISKGWNKKYSGKPAINSPDTHGYLMGTLCGWSLPRAHRVAWALATGAWPEDEIDHINGVRSDNRLVNLRPATRSQNRANIDKSWSNKSGYKGVRLDARSGKWRAQITKDGISTFLGTFDSPEDANSAYVSAAIASYGEFACGGRI